MSTGDNIGKDIAAVGTVVSPIVTAVTTAVNPAIGPAVGRITELAFKVLAVVEPAAYNAIAALLSGQALTPEQEQVIKDVETRLLDPDSYLAE